MNKIVENSQEITRHHLDMPSETRLWRALGSRKKFLFDACKYQLQMQQYMNNY
jgi:hypothetical protein